MSTFLTWISLVVTAGGSIQGTAWWDAQVEASLDRAPVRKDRWVNLLESCPPDARPGLAYLVKYLPLRDLEAMSPEALCANMALAYQARAEVPWGASLPGGVFLDAVLPHISTTEPASRCGPSSTTVTCRSSVIASGPARRPCC